MTQKKKERTKKTQTKNNDDDNNSNNNNKNDENLTKEKEKEVKKKKKKKTRRRRRTATTTTVTRRTRTSRKRRRTRTKTNWRRNRQRQIEKRRTHDVAHPGACWLVACLLNVPETCECISGTDLLRQFYVLPHWDRGCRSTFYLTQSQYTDTEPISPITLGRVATGVPIFKSLVWLDPEKVPVQARFKPGIFLSRGGRLNH